MFWAAEHYKNTVSLLIIGGCWIIYVDEYRSGHNEAVLKTVGPKGHGGSNPSSSANMVVVVEMAYTLDCGSSIWGFKSLRLPHK